MPVFAKDQEVKDMKVQYMIKCVSMKNNLIGMLFR